MEEKEDEFEDAVQTPQPSPHPTSKKSASLIPYTPERAKSKRKSKHNTVEAEDDALVVYEARDSLRKLLAKTIQTAETTVKRSRRATKATIADIRDPNLPWGQMALQTFIEKLPPDLSQWDSAFDKQCALILKERRNVARQEDNAFIVEQLNSFNEWMEETLTNMPA